MKRTFNLILLITALLAALPAWAATRHVDAVAGACTGNYSIADRNCMGSDGNSYATIALGIAATAAADTLYIRAGTYVENLYNPPSGTDDAHHTVVAGYPGERPIIKPTGGTQGALVGVQYNHSFLTFQNLVIDGADATAIDGITICDSGHSGSTCSYILIQNCEIKNGLGGGTGGGAITMRSSDTNLTTNVTIQDNLIHDWAWSIGTTLDHGIYLAAANSVAQRNTIYNVWGHGIHVYHTGGGTLNNVVRSNTIHDCGSFGIGLYQGSGSSAYNNLVYQTGVNVAGSGGIAARLSGVSMTVYNNTVFGATGYGMRVDASITGTVIRNNILYNSSTANYSDAGTGTTVSNNLCNATGAGCAVGGDPKFVGAGAGNFRLAIGSPAINAGYDLSGLFISDYDGNARPMFSAFDIGAYEYSFYLAGQGCLRMWLGMGL